jgi:hypothetical protein
MTLGLGDLAFAGSLGGGITDPDAQAYITAVLINAFGAAIP